MSPTTIAGYRKNARVSYDGLKQIRVKSLTLQNVQKWVSMRVATASGKTIRNELSMLSSALKMAGVRLDTSSLKIPKQTRKEIQIPSENDVRQMLADSEGEFRVALMLGAYCGLRRAEICALRWADCLPTSIHVRQAMVRGNDGGYAIKGTKTGAGTRVVPISGQIYTALQAVRDQDDKVIHLTPDAITRRF